jgi:hypothetical protein
MTMNKDSSISFIEVFKIGNDQIRLEILNVHEMSVSAIQNTKDKTRSSGFSITLNSVSGTVKYTQTEETEWRLRKEKFKVIKKLFQNHWLIDIKGNDIKAFRRVTFEKDIGKNPFIELDAFGKNLDLNYDENKVIISSLDYKKIGNYEHLVIINWDTHLTIKGTFKPIHLLKRLVILSGVR